MARRSALEFTALTPQLVIRAAADLADELGNVEHVTLAGVAAHFGVRVPSLYHHVDGLAGLVRGVSLLSLLELADCMREAARGKQGGEALIAVAHAYRRFGRAFPGRYTATVLVRESNDVELMTAAHEINKFLAELLLAYRFHTEDALHTIRALRSLAHGFISLEAVGAFGLDLDREESYRRMIATFIQGLEQGAGRPQ